MKNRFRVIFMSCVLLMLSSLCTDYSHAAQAEKGMLDESIRYIKAPEEGAAFGLIQEKRLRFSLEVSEKYDDNIFLTKDNTQHDFITDIIPSAAFTFGNSDHLFFASYMADVLIYAEHNSQTRVNQALETRAELFRSGLARVVIRDTLKPTSDPATSETNDFVKRLYNDLNVKAIYDLSEKTSFEIEFDQVVQNYISSSYQDYSYFSNVIYPRVYWHLSPKTSITADAGVGYYDYYEGTNYDNFFYQGRLGIEGVLTPKSSIFLRAGYQYKQYESSARKNAQGAVLEGVYDYRLSPKTMLEFIASRQLTESVYENEGYYNSTNFYLSVKHDMMNTLSMKVSGFYLNGDYPQETYTSTGDLKKRFDNTYGGTARLEYRPRNWILAYVGYEFRDRASNMRDFEYINNRIYCGGKLDF